MSAHPAAPTNTAWSPTSWTTRPAEQQPAYRDAVAVERVVGELSRLPPTVVSWEIDDLKRMPAPATQKLGLWLAAPAALDETETHTEVTPWTAEPEQYGDFLIAIYEEWVRQDVGTTFVMNFEWALTAWLGEPSPVCIFAKQCGRAVALEHDWQCVRLRPLCLPRIPARQRAHRQPW